MVYKHKNNKWSRLIAARKLAAAAAAVETDQPLDTSREAAAVDDVRGAAEAEGLKKTLGANDGTRRAVAAEEEEQLVTAATVGDDTPCVLDVFHVPDNSGEAALAGFIGYVLRSADTPPLRDSGDAGDDAVGTDAGLLTVTTVFGVCKEGTTGVSCLQVVRWEEASAAADASPLGTPTKGVLPQPTQQQQHPQLRLVPSLPSAPHELLLFVDAEGRCFTLSTSSVISVEHHPPVPSARAVEEAGEERSMAADRVTAEAAAEDQKKGGRMGANTTAYWMIPTALRDHFVALLQALTQWRAQHHRLLSASSEKTRAVLHATRWFDTRTTITAAAEESTQTTAATTAAAALTEHKGKNSKKKTKKAAAKRSRLESTSHPQPPPAEAATVKEVLPACDAVNTTAATAADAVRIPYVVGVEKVKDGSEALLLVLGNRLSPFPNDYVL